MAFNRAWENAVVIRAGTMLSPGEFKFKHKPLKPRPVCRPLPDHVVKAIQKHSRPKQNKMAFYEKLAKRFKCSPKTVCNIILGYRR